MSETKTPWTPGPWTTEESEYAGDWIIHDAEGEYLAEVANGYINAVFREAHAPRTEATARLIAAAPEMAELLERILSVRADHPFSYLALTSEIHALLAKLKGD